MNAGASTYAVPSPIKGSGTAWVLLGSWALSPARPTPIHPRHECRGLSALFGESYWYDGGTRWRGSYIYEVFSLANVAGKLMQTTVCLGERRRLCRSCCEF